MPNKRQWLKQQGFEVGSRGRFSQAMLDALATATVEFTDSPTSVIHTKHGDVHIEKRTRNKRTSGVPPRAALPEVGWVELDEIMRRDLPAGYIIRLPDGHTTQWTICYKCSYSIKFCTCPRPTMAPWMEEQGALAIDLLT
jgi:hypothetical protein